MFGFLNINKPAGMTSHDIVAVVRREARQRYGKKVKVGHAGTLDPMATGVLIVCVGHATRLSEYVMASTKRYHAEVTLGAETDTYDADGEVIAQYDASQVTREDVEAILPQFKGDIEQIPPMYSAIKQDGKKLYELARQGKEVERPARPVRIDGLTITNWYAPVFDLDVVCSSGTYIRSLAYDIGQALGIGAHLSALTRTASGAFALYNAVELYALTDIPAWEDVMISPEDALSDWPTIRLDDEAYDHIIHGRMIPAVGDVPADGTMARALSPDGDFVAILMLRDSMWKPHKVFLLE